MLDHSYDPLPGQFNFVEMTAVSEELAGRLRDEVATANHVFDTLRAATLDELKAHEPAVYRLFAALPQVLSYRLFRLHAGNLRYDAPQRDPRQPFWRRQRERLEFDHITTGN